MIALQIARLIANFSLFLDLADEDLLDPDAAVQTIEILGVNLQAIDPPFLRELVDAFAIIAEEYTGESQQLVRNMASDFFLEETIAADDPVRLAELEALRDADDLHYRELNAAVDDVAPSEPFAEESAYLNEQPTAWQRLRSWPRSRL